MSQIRLVLADKDLMFLEKFSAYLQRNKSNRFSLELISSPSKLEEWLNKGGKADLSAISAALLSEMTIKPENRNIVILGDCPESLLPQGYACINKYQPAEVLMKEILSLCSEKMPESYPEKGGVSRIQLVLYADGSDALNPIAQTLACIKAQNSQSVFYLSLDEFSNSDAYFSSNNSKGLSEMLYYIKSQKDNLTLKAEACSSKDLEFGVDFMKGHKNTEDISKLTGSEAESLIRSIAGRALYDEIIISRAFKNDELLLLLLKQANSIIITGMNYRTSLDRLNRIAEIISGIDEENGLEIKNKARLFITLTDKEQRPQNLSIPQYSLMYLPCPLNEGASFFPPSGPYISALKSITDL